MNEISPLSIGLIVLIAAACVAFVIEWRITRQPPSQWTEGQRRFMAANTQSTLGIRFFARRVAPAIGLAASALLIIVGIVQLSTGSTTLGIVEIVVGILAVGGMIFLLRRSPTAAETVSTDKEPQHSNSNADTSWQSPHPRGALIAGGGFILFGVVTLLTTLNTAKPEWIVGIGLIVCGLGVGISALRTLRQR